MYVENTGARNEAGIKLKNSYCALPIADGSAKKIHCCGTRLRRHCNMDCTTGTSASSQPCAEHVVGVMILREK